MSKAKKGNAEDRNRHRKGSTLLTMILITGMLFLSAFAGSGCHHHGHPHEGLLQTR